MNRLFPGPARTARVTEKIADFFQRTLLPMADIVLDFHSGGRTLDFVPFAACHVLPDKAQEARCIAARDAFGAPYSMTMLEIDAVGMYDTAAEALGKVFVTTELGGGGTATARTVAIAKRGVRNVLKHAGILEGAVGGERLRSSSTCRPPTASPSASRDGLVEPAVDLGGAVRAGDVLARVHPVDRLGGAPAEYRARDRRHARGAPLSRPDRHRRLPRRRRGGNLIAIS